VYPENLQKFIPPEFNLAKYDEAASMDLINWIENLMVRALVFSSLGKLQDEKLRHFIVELNTKNITRGIIINSPLIKLFNGLIQDDVIGYSAAVRELTYLDLFDHEDIFKTDGLEVLYSEYSFFDDILNKDKFDKLIAPYRPIDSLNETPLSWLEVDLNSSDSEIKDSFTHWLTKTREKQKSDGEKSKRRDHKLKKLNIVAFRKWHDAKVLAYIDLVTWNSLRGNKPTSFILGNILFPDPKDITDKGRRVDDTVAPYAAELTSLTSLKRMFKVLGEHNRKEITEKSS